MIFIVWVRITLYRVQITYAFCLAIYSQFLTKDNKLEVRQNIINFLENQKDIQGNAIINTVGEETDFGAGENGENVFGHQKYKKKIKKEKYLYSRFCFVRFIGGIGDVVLE